MSGVLSKKQFDVLTYMEYEAEAFDVEQSSRDLGVQEDEMNAVLSELTEAGYIEQGKLTEVGYQALEPYRVKRVILIAAGFGSRLAPITINTPKPLVRVNGTRMIDTLLDATVKAGIDEVYIVRGYLGEQFDQLLYKYPSIQFIDNPFYKEANNISSAFLARHLMQNAYVMEADLVLYNPRLICKYQYSSNYLGVPTEYTDDWCFETDHGVITALKVGGTNCHHVYGISYWNEDDGARLADDIKTAYEMPEGKTLYWDQVALEHFIANYRVEVRNCTFEDIVEIDSFSDLKNIDESYR